MVDAARAHGYLVYATLAYTPAWATSGDVRSGVPFTPEHYGRFVTAVVERYRDRVKHWGLWNEPEGSRFWAGTAEQFVEYVMRPGFEAVRAADPGALVLGPDSGNDDWLDDIFAAGGGDYVDIITVHVYACCDDTDDVRKVLLRLDCTGGWPWDNCRRRVIERRGLGDKPVWLTEVGWKTLTPEWETKQADYYVGLLDAMLERPWWRKTIFYELYDATPCDAAVDNCWGIIRPDWSRKPAFDALRGWVAAHQPRAEAGADVSVRRGEEVFLDGSTSTDPDGDLVLFRWDFDRRDGVYAEAEGAAASHVYDVPGSYVATLVVTDNDGLEDGDTVTIAVGDLGPCETSVPCAAAGDCATVELPCACPGSWICNASSRCEWRCDEPPDGGPPPDGGDDAAAEDDAAADEPGEGAADADVATGETSPDDGTSIDDGAAGDGTLPGGGGGEGCGCILAGGRRAGAFALVAPGLALVVRRRRRDSARGRRGG
jgi:hypothetical protein